MLIFRSCEFYWNAHVLHLQADAAAWCQPPALRDQLAA
jgi:hypothetical protein